MIKKLVTVAAAGTFLMAAPVAFAQDATNSAGTAGTAPATTTDTNGAAATTDTSGAAATTDTSGAAATTDTSGAAATTDTSGAAATTDTSGAAATTDTSGAATSGTAATTTPNTTNDTAATNTTDAGEVAGNYLTAQGENQMSADQYIGTTVYNSKNESIGEINDLIIEKNGGIAAAVIGVGGFLGIGEKNVAVPMSNITASQDKDGSDLKLKLTTSETSETLKNAPEFKTLAQTRTVNDSTMAPGATDPATGTVPADGTAPADGSATGTAPATGTDTSGQ